MVDDLDQVAIGILDVGVVLAAVLATPLPRIGATDVGAGARSRCADMLDAELVEARHRGVPVVDFDREMTRGRDDRARRHGKVDLAAAEPELELPPIERRAPVEELSAEDLLVPGPRPLAIAHLHVDVVDQLDGHAGTVVRGWRGVKSAAVTAQRP